MNRRSCLVVCRSQYSWMGVGVALFRPFSFRVNGRPAFQGRGVFGGSELPWRSSKTSLAGCCTGYSTFEWLVRTTNAWCAKNSVVYYWSVKHWSLAGQPVTIKERCILKSLRSKRGKQDRRKRLTKLNSQPAWRLWSSIIWKPALLKMEQEAKSWT